MRKKGEPHRLGGDAVQKEKNMKKKYLYMIPPERGVISHLATDQFSTVWYGFSIEGLCDSLVKKRRKMLENCKKNIKKISFISE